MGLAINALRGLSKEAEVEVIDGDNYDAQTGEYLEGFFIPVNLPEFQQRSEDIPLAAYYAEAEMMVASFPYSDVWVFRGYLLEIGGYIEHFDVHAADPSQEDPEDKSSLVVSVIRSFTEGPFYEFIWFPDYVGTFGTKMSQKLYQDFVEHAEKAKHVLADTSFMDLYNQLLEGFKFATDNGCVVFE